MIKQYLEQQGKLNLHTPKCMEYTLGVQGALRRHLPIEKLLVWRTHDTQFFRSTDGMARLTSDFSKVKLQTAEEGVLIVSYQQDLILNQSFDESVTTTRQ